MSLLLRNLVFTVAVPGAGGGYVPWLILTRHGAAPAPAAWYATAVIAAGIVLYLSCVWFFGTAGRGTPGTWDPPQRLVAAGPYRWVRNPIYLAALLIVAGEAWLFFSPALLAYAAALAVAFQSIQSNPQITQLEGALITLLLPGGQQQTVSVGTTKGAVAVPAAAAVPPASSAA